MSTPYRLGVLLALTVFLVAILFFLLALTVPAEEPLQVLPGFLT